MSDTLVRLPGGEQLAFHLDSPLDKRFTNHIYLLLTSAFTSTNLDYVHAFFFFFPVCVASLMRSHPMYLFVCAMNASGK